MPLVRGTGDRTFANDFPHQTELVERTERERAWAIFWQMGVAKSRPTIETMVRRYLRHEVDGVIVVAPNGVHRNWPSDELPRHCRIPWIALDWHSTHAGSKDQRQAEDALCGAAGSRPEPRDTAPMPWLAITYEGLLTSSGIAMARRFAGRFRRYGFVVDESSRIKNPSARRSKQVHKIAWPATVTRLLNGTPISNSPLDLYSQMIALDEQFWKRRGISSFTAFKARFAIIREIKIGAARDPSMGKVGGPAADLSTSDDTIAGYEQLDLSSMIADDAAASAVDERRDEPAPPTSETVGSLATGRTVRIVAGYRDLDKIKAMIEPMSSRLTKEEAGLDLPAQLYRRIPFELHPEQRRAYDTLRKQFMIEINGVLITAAIAMVRILRLHQIACGYLPNTDDADAPAIMIPGDGKQDPRFTHLMDLVEDIPGKALIWCRFRMDIDRITAALGPACVRYDGAVTSPTARAAAIERFRKDPAVRFFVANPSAIGMGVTLVEAQDTIYYSNSYVLPDRLQSESRNHRVGQHNAVTYHDLVALRTVDEKIIKALIDKVAISDKITGDAFKQWLE